MADESNIDETIDNALDVTIPQAAEVAKSAEPVLIGQMVETDLWFGFTTLETVALLMFVVAAMNALTTIKSFHNDRLRRQHELFDRRTPTFQTAIDFAYVVSDGRKVSDELYRKLMMAVDVAEFLFDYKTRMFLMSMYQEYDKTMETMYYEKEEIRHRELLTHDFLSAYGPIAVMRIFKPFLRLE